MRRIYTEEDLRAAWDASRHLQWYGECGGPNEPEPNYSNYEEWLRYAHEALDYVERYAPAQIDWIPGPPKEDGRYLIAYRDYYGEEKVSANPTYYVNDPINASDNITHHAAWPQYPYNV